MKKFQPTSKCSLILCACIAVAFSPLAEADSAARDHAPPSSLRRQEGSKSLYWNRSRIFDGNYEEKDWNDDDDDARPYWDNPITIANLNKDSELFNKSRLKINPENYEDDGKLYVEFTCEASLTEDDRLRWYEFVTYKEFTGGRLNSISRYVEQSEQAVSKTLKLTHPLTAYQRNAILYCIKEHEEEDGNISSTISNNITLDFQTKKDYLLESLYHYVRPRRTTFGVFYYNDTVPLVINCFSRIFRKQEIESNYYVAWYQVQGNEKKLLTMATFEATERFSPNMLRLELSKLWKPSDDGTKYFCAQEYWFTNETTLKKHTAYESELFTLKYRLDECSPWLPWMSAAVAMLVVFLAEGAAVALAVIICCRPKTSKTPNPVN